MTSTYYICAGLAAVLFALGSLCLRVSRRLPVDSPRGEGAYHAGMVPLFGSVLMLIVAAMG